MRARRMAGSLLVAFAAFGASIVAGPLAAQSPARVTGRVEDADTRLPLDLVELRLDGLTAVTGADGGFAFASVPPGRHLLRLRRVGYEPGEEEVVVEPGSEQRLRLVLRPRIVRLDSVAVVAAPAAPGAIAAEHDVLVRRGHDLAQALDGWEGVAVRRGPDGRAAPTVRGSAADEVLVVVDGIVLNDPLTGRADLGRVSTGEVARVTLMPGAQATRAGGRAVAGVLVVETRAPTAPQLTTWAGSHAATGAHFAGEVGPAALDVGVDVAPHGFPYTVPAGRGGGEAHRLNADATLATLAAHTSGPVALTVRASASARGLPGTTTNPTPEARADDHLALIGVHGGGALEWGGTVQWVDTRARDTAPPVGQAYDARSNGVGAEGGLGLRRATSVAGWAMEGGPAVEGRIDRFGGNAVRDGGATFRRAALRFDATLRRGAVALAPAARLDVWSGLSAPRASARLDAEWRVGRTAISAAAGSAVVPPVPADLFFHEGVGVRLNPDLRPERVRWEVEAGVRRGVSLLGVETTLGARAFAGRVADMVLWAVSPAYHFTWSPGNFDVRRRGGEVSLQLAPRADVRVDAGATWAAVTYDRPGGAQVIYRPRFTANTALQWTGRPWGASARWHLIGSRYPNSSGINPLPAISLLDLGLERRLGMLLARAEVRDVGDTRAEFIAGLPSPGRTIVLTLTLDFP